MPGVSQQAPHGPARGGAPSIRGPEWNIASERERGGTRGRPPGGAELVTDADHRVYVRERYRTWMLDRLR
ncbi:hypothetical protein ACFYSH_15725 [Streptomyces sp. NPDC005791]|uniref:hypothetical protein n=1 Tax=Streptomyces sp. NPDC005791 TaxID=3364732 RepID=UPI0036A4EADB